MFWGDYVNGPTTPLYAFGHGLTFTTFEHGPLEVVAAGTTADQIVLHATVTNSGHRVGTEVVQLYVHDLIASVARPVQQLVGFTRIELRPGQSGTIVFEVHPNRLAFYDEAMNFVTEPGTFRFTVGGASDTAAHEVDVELTGETAHYRQRDVTATRVAALT